MMRNWRMLIWNGKKFVVPTSDGEHLARSPGHALKLFGLDFDCYTTRYSRKGYGYFTGRIYVYLPETITVMEMGKHLPADFILEIIE